MTREEAYKKVFESTKIDRNSKKFVDKLIKEIYDDFENRKCENCEYFDKLPYGLQGQSPYTDIKNIGICTRFKKDNEYTDFEEEKMGIKVLAWDNYGLSIYVRVSKDFGCNEFERKENE